MRGRRVDDADDDVVDEDDADHVAPMVSWTTLINTGMGSTGGGPEYLWLVVAGAAAAAYALREKRNTILSVDVSIVRTVVGCRNGGSGGGAGHSFRRLYQRRASELLGRR